MKTRNLFFFAVLLSALTFFTSCTDMVKKIAMKAMEETASFEKEDTVKWGRVVEQDLDLPAFTAIDAKGIVRVVFTQDSIYAVRARGNEKCIADYKFTVRKGKLQVEPKDFNGSVNKRTPAVTLFISAPNLSDVEIAGAGKLESVGPTVLTGSLDIEMAGTGDISMENLTVEALNIELEGAGKCALAKVMATGDIEIEVNGAGDINANVFCQDLTLEINGAGNAVLSGECKNLICEENGASKVDISKLKR